MRFSGDITFGQFEIFKMAYKMATAAVTVDFSSNILDIDSNSIGR